MNSFKGSRWHKCDFHIHTPTSKCFKDKEISMVSFIEKVFEEGLDCIAITDHNAGAGIDEVKELAKERGITVFPGVEVTCSDSKIHLLVLFDTDKDSRYVEDYLLGLGLKRDQLGEETAHIHKEVFEVVEESNRIGAIVIPAHIDEYNGLSKISNQSKLKIFNKTEMNAVQIVHQNLLNPNLAVKNNDELLNYFHNYYNNYDISSSQIKEWRSCNKYIEKCALLTFSDNPDFEKKSKHGIGGIGKKYTWIKMGSKPNLESLRQALILPKLRIRNYFQSKEQPYKLPKVWIKSIKVSNTALLEKGKDIEINFSPQMSTIIGGRGSGKSSFINMLRGVFNRVNDLSDLNNIRNEFLKYYKVSDSNKEGVFNDKSTIVVEVIMNKIKYKITATEINSHDDQSISIEKWDSNKSDYIVIDNEEYIDLFKLDIYSQKQIYEIAQSPNALRQRIDNSIPNVITYKSKIKERELQYINISSKIHEMNQKLDTKKLLEAELEEKLSQIKSYNESGLTELLNDRNKFVNEEEKLKDIIEELEEKSKSFDILRNELININFDSQFLSDSYRDDIKELLKELEKNINLCSQRIIETKDIFIKGNTIFKDSIKTSRWYEGYKKNKYILETKKENSNMFIELDVFENLLREKEDKKKEISEFKEIENKIEQDSIKLESVYNDILEFRLRIFDERKTFLNKILESENVKIEVKRCRDKQLFESKLREIIQKPNEFEQSITHIVNKAFNDKLPEGLTKIHKDLKALRNDNTIDGYDGHFKNCIKNLNNEQFARLFLLIPEDEILAKYKVSEDREYKSISNASAGQKTATILTYILSQGDTPLILDQPEDDLDNKLVYGLIVDRLREAKENRQIIVVTHNANIPVNGDSEYITAMDSESKYINVLSSGAIEDDNICNEICDVMEGGEDAFNLRSKRYNI